MCLLKGELRQLRGLGLAGNPLCCPPTAMVRRGTSAVLRYLRGQLRARRSGERREMGSGGEGERGSVESGTDSGEKDYLCIIQNPSDEFVIMQMRSTLVYLSSPSSTPLLVHM